MPPSTRKAVDFKLKNLIGPGKEFLPSEVPTLRAVIQKGILIQEKLVIEEEESRHLLSTYKLSEVLASEVQTQWQLSNEKFIEPITLSNKSLANRIKRYWDSLTDAANGKLAKAPKERLLDKLDRLFDIISCQHQVVLCDSSDVKCKGCSYKAHIINCTCKVKVPKLELQWLYYQRTKSSEKSQLQIASADVVENKKEVKREHRKQLETRRGIKKKESAATKALIEIDHSDW